MRKWILTIAFALLFLPLAAPGEESGREMTWEGYLWRDGEGRVRLGWPVIAMGVMAMPAHVIDGDLAARLAPFVSGLGDSHFFWNYSVAVRAEEPLPEYPKALVRIRGNVVLRGGREGGLSGRSGTHVLRGGRLLSVEWIREEWLRAWAPWFTGQPRSVKVRPGQKEIGYERAFAPKALAALRAMRKVEGPTQTERAALVGIDPDARLVQDFRRSQEAVILRWLTAKNEELSLGLGDLEEEFGKPPPSSVQVQRWFLASGTKRAFLAKIREEWSGPLDALTLAFYIREGDRTRYAVTPVLSIEEEWSEEDYERHLGVSKAILAR
jgi:hypothetical protein